jgi:hypothetical protein
MGNVFKPLGICLAVSLLGLSCHQQSRSTANPDRPKGDREQVNWWGAHLWNHTANGIVTLDGVPRPYFGVTLTRDHQHAHLYGVSPPAVFRGNDGKFTISAPEPGEWDLIVVGPGFARWVVKKIRIGSLSPSSPLRIEVARGYTVQGVVIDSRHNAVTAATITITQGIATPTGEPLWELSQGNSRVQSDDSGHFRFDDVSSIDPVATIQAFSVGGEASLPQRLPDKSASIRLILLPVGRIDGRVEGDLGGAVIVAESVSDATARLSARADQAGKFSFPEIPIGDYHLLAFSSTARDEAPRGIASVTVSAGIVVNVSISVRP